VSKQGRADAQTDEGRERFGTDLSELSSGFDFVEFRIRAENPASKAARGREIAPPGQRSEIRSPSFDASIETET
jgi:hypothetical protein